MGGLTTDSLRRRSEQAEPKVETHYLGCAIGPGQSVGPQADFKTIDELMEFVKDHVEIGAVVTVTAI